MLHRRSRPIGDDDLVICAQETMHPFLSPGSLSILVPLILVVAAGAFALGRRGRRELSEERERLQTQVERSADTSGEQVKRAVAKMRREQATVSNLALALPTVVRSLNRDDLDPVEVPPLILQLSEALFSPRRILLYGFRNGGNGERTLFLSAHRGLNEVPPELREIRLDQGKIG